MVTMGITTRASRLRILALFATLWAFPVAQAVTEVKDVASGNVPSARFSCSGRTPGYYADVASGCQRYHMCDSGGRLYSYSCPNQTLFQQRVMICDHWFMVDCSLSVNYYSSNLNIGVKGTLFIAGHEDGSRRTSNRRSPGTSQSFSASTTPYPWRRATSATPPRTVTSFTPGERINKQPVLKKSTVEKVSKSPVARNENNVVIKKDNVELFAPTANTPTEWTLPKEYANNPFFRGLTGAPTEATNIITTDKGHREVLTSPLGKVQTNVFDKIAGLNRIYFTSTAATSLETRAAVSASSSLSTGHKFNTFSTPSQELRKRLPNHQESTSTALTTESPFNSGQNFVTPRGQFVQRQDEFRNSFPYKFNQDETPPSTVQYDERPRDSYRLEADFVSDEDAEISPNTVELRFPDPRHMFYIADTPTREAEMLNSNNETVLTIALPTYKHHGAMKFKGSRNPKGRRNDCPQCHPAFLLPDRCQPCVLIRR